MAEDDYEWPMYDLGEMSLAVGPGPEDQDEYFFLLVVGDNGYPLACYPDIETAKEAAALLDQAMTAVMEAADHECEQDDCDHAPAKKGKAKAKSAPKKTAKKLTPKTPAAKRKAQKTVAKMAAKMPAAKGMKRR